MVSELKGKKRQYSPSGERYFTKNNMGLLPLRVRRVERFSPGMTCRAVTLMRRHHRGRRGEGGKEKHRQSSKSVEPRLAPSGHISCPDCQ
ncbi:hypothetical protein E2C01_003321 [Portunus trituberculatus]|uniref:Uncharacterized protein n=1 Tax=Portunus trituberculatus TaxID=210409 RepID=A0A5B7CLW8_PORTR|nr:hypothetical protein [Portunus trituberculatus]